MRQSCMIFENTKSIEQRNVRKCAPSYMDICIVLFTIIVICLLWYFCKQDWLQQALVINIGVPRYDSSQEMHNREVSKVSDQHNMSWQKLIRLYIWYWGITTWYRDYIYFIRYKQLRANKLNHIVQCFFTREHVRINK